MKHTDFFKALRTLLSCVTLLCLLGASSAFAASGIMYVHTENGFDLNVRQAPKAGARKVGSLANGSSVSVLSRSGDWFEIRFGNQTAYVKAEFLASSAPKVTNNAAEASWRNVSRTMYVLTQKNSRLNLRQEARQRSRSLGLYANGTAVRVTALSARWAKVRVGEKEGYMMLAYLTDQKPENAGNQEVYKAYIRSGSAGLYAEAGAQSQKLLTLPGGTEVKTYIQRGAWTQVTVHGRVGFVKTSLLTTEKPDAVARYATVVNPNGASFVNLRSSPGIKGQTNVLTCIRIGKEVQVMGRIKSWYKILSGGDAGYVHSSFLSFEK